MAAVASERHDAVNSHGCINRACCGGACAVGRGGAEGPYTRAVVDIASAAVGSSHAAWKRRVSVKSVLGHQRKCSHFEASSPAGSGSPKREPNTLQAGRCCAGAALLEGAEHRRRCTEHQFGEERTAPTRNGAVMPAPLSRNTCCHEAVLPPCSRSPVVGCRAAAAAATGNDEQCKRLEVVVDSQDG